jgi:hypothetical protein
MCHYDVAPRSFDHLLSLYKHRSWDLEAEDLSGLEINYHFYLSALLDWEVSRLGALENFPNVDPCLLIKIEDSASVTHQAAEIGECPYWIKRRYRVAGCQGNKLHSER